MSNKGKVMSNIHYIHSNSQLTLTHTRGTSMTPTNNLSEVTECVGLTDAGSDGGAALLVALSAAVTGDSRHSVLAGALTRRLVARLPCCSDWMAVACYGGRRGKAKSTRT